MYLQRLLSGRVVFLLAGCLVCAACTPRPPIGSGGGNNPPIAGVALQVTVRAGTASLPGPPVPGISVRGMRETPQDANMRVLSGMPGPTGTDGTTNLTLDNDFPADPVTGTTSVYRFMLFWSVNGGLVRLDGPFTVTLTAADNGATIKRMFFVEGATATAGE